MADFCIQTIAFGPFKEGARVLIKQLSNESAISGHDVKFNLISDDANFLQEMINSDGNVAGLHVTSNIRDRVNHYLAKRENIGENFFNTLYKYVTFLDHGADVNIWMDADMLLTGPSGRFFEGLSDIRIGFVPRMKAGFHGDANVLTCRMNRPSEYSFIIGNIADGGHDEEMWHKFTGEAIECEAKGFPRANTGLFVAGKTFMSRDLVNSLLQFAAEPKRGKPGAKNQSDQNDLNIAIKEGFFGEKVIILPEKYNVNVGEIKSNDESLSRKIINDVLVLHYPGEKKPWNYMDDWIIDGSKLNSDRNFFWRSRREWFIARRHFLTEQTKSQSSSQGAYTDIDGIFDWRGIPF